MRFDPESIKQGRANQRATSETPESFATIDGAAQPRDSMELSKGNTRMAGQLGARALMLMNDPAEQNRTEAWTSRFGLTNQGAMWNQAKMGVPAEDTQN